MRIKMFLLAAVALLATTLPAQASAVLGFGFANTNNTNFVNPNDTTNSWSLQTGVFALDPSTPLGGPPGSNIDPRTSFGLEDLTGAVQRLGNTNGAVAGTSGNPFQLVGGQDYVIQLMLVDTVVSPTFSNANKLQSWKLNLNNSNTAALMLRHDADVINPQGATYLTTETVANDGSGISNENLPSANNNTAGTNPNFTMIQVGNLLGTSWNGNSTPSGVNKVMGLMNFVIHAQAAGGSGSISITEPGAGIDFSNAGGGSLDSVVFATLPSVFFTVTPAPEPSSMALMGLAVSGLAYRIRRKKAAAAAAAAV